MAKKKLYRVIRSFVDHDYGPFGTDHAPIELPPDRDWLKAGFLEEVEAESAGRGETPKAKEPETTIKKPGETTAKPAPARTRKTKKVS